MISRRQKEWTSEQSVDPDRVAAGLKDYLEECADATLGTREPAVAQQPVRKFDSVLCFGDSDWWYHNRGHADMQFMRRFARRWPTVYVNSLGVSAPTLSEGRAFLLRVKRKASSMMRYYRDGGEGFSVLSPIYLPGRKGLAGRLLNRGLAAQIRMVLRLKGMRRPLVWVACPTAARVLDRIPSAGIVHQLSDCYSALHNGNAAAAAEMEQAVAVRADLVVCSSARLQERARMLYEKGEYLDHGVDVHLFDAASQVSCTPPELQRVSRPLIGFFGNLDSNTVDRNLLAEVIRLRPRYTFMLVGRMAPCFEMLKPLPNVVAVQQKPYRSIPCYGKQFDVCLMPWRQSEWIEHCNPVKLKEYLALGKPVVSTYFPELALYEGLCYVAKKPADFAYAIDRALAEDNPARQQQRQACAAAHGWTAKFDQVMELLHARGIAAHDGASLGIGTSKPSEPLDASQEGLCGAVPACQCLMGQMKV